MDFVGLNLYLVIALTIMLGIGVTLCFVGALITVAIAFGNQDKKWAIVCVALLPLTAVYCLLNRESTRYPQKYLMIGVSLIVGCVLIVAGLTVAR